ncbi:MAG: hypothetical protein H6940_04105 [Burkholderiales bacterium]|uniref:hypothetical protein n=1 Tax=Nitrosomonas sp. TaxID=42353 RepID=UPI001D1AF0C7|nr:hypothetical protein [Nitrosomonas sp.]MCB1948413.1 hypothetical protein [Nitrosomonas sp.]MCP5242609.1 hypothetical protein [Burkholderiales bacterium]
MDYLEGFVAMTGHVAWPITAIGIAVIARKELRSIIAALAKRIEDKNSAVSITKEGVEIKAVVEAQEARLVSMQAEQDQVKSLALQHFKPAQTYEIKTLRQTEPKDIDSQLRKMADKYMDINLPDYSERTRAKNAAAGEMAFYIVSNKISKDQLANESHEGLLIALAESIILSADTGDAERLLKAARGAKRLHVRYRVLIAITKLYERNLLPLADIGTVRELLREYEVGADSSLKRLVSNVTSLINEAVNMPKD